MPIAPELVKILRKHIAKYGTAKDGRILRSERAGVVVASPVYTEVWQDAHLLAFTPAQAGLSADQAPVWPSGKQR